MTTTTPSNLPRPASGVKGVRTRDEIERQAREQKLDAAARQQLRQQHSVGEVSALNERLLAIRQAVLPGSQLAKACDDTLRIWERLEVFLSHGAVEVDTNLAENLMRPVALGRKN